VAITPEINVSSGECPTSSFLKPQSPQLHIDGETCPWCEQKIPPEKLEEINGKIAAREREQTHAIAAKLEQQHAIDKTEADAKAKADLEC
jgi:DNA repair exonuclease SbcCD ATPase subunit